MGIGHSRSHPQQDEQINPVRKQIGKRSSVNFLQKLDSRSLPPRPVSFAAKIQDGDDLHFPIPHRPWTSHPMSPPTSMPALSPASTRTVLRTQDQVASSSYPESGEALGTAEANLPNQMSQLAGDNDNRPRPFFAHENASGCDSMDEDPAVSLFETPQLSDGSTVDEPVENEDHNEALTDPFEEYEGSEPDTPIARPITVHLTPVLRMPTPLARDSPIKYGFDEAFESARVAVSREMQNKRATTGPELFYQALDLHHSIGYEYQPPNPVPHRAPPKKHRPANMLPCQVYRPPRSKYSPSVIFRRALQRDHLLPPPRAKEASPRNIRLLRRPWPQNLTRDEVTPGQAVRYALALPLSQSQRQCYGKHRKWIESSNRLCPVECAICLCASDCSADTTVFWMCQFCAIRICSGCKGRFDSEGMGGLMKKFADGSKTIEAKKAGVRQPAL